mgnify:FL=1
MTAEGQAAALAASVRHALHALVESQDPAAFAELLALGQAVGECVGEKARRLSQERSWSAVAQASGISKQAAWSRWRGE